MYRPTRPLFPRHWPALVLFGSLSLCAQAGPFALSGPAQSNGGGYLGQTITAGGPNPAASAFAAQLAGDDKTLIGRLHLAGALEYGDVEELFELYDELAAGFDDSDSGSGSGASADNGLALPDIDINNPNLDALLDAVSERATRLAAVLAVVASEGYANGDLGSDFAMNFTRPWLGGYWGLSYHYGGSASAQGFLEPLEFDRDQALTELQAAFNLTPADPVTEFDLSSGLRLTVDPANGRASATFDNDSLFAARAAEQQVAAVDYNYVIPLADQQQLILGTRAKYISMGLSRVVLRVGDISDAEEIFDEIRDGDFRTTENFGMDFGALLTGPQYLVGLSVLDAFEPTYKFNEVDTSNITNPDLAALIESQTRFKQKAQWTADASLFSQDRQWSAGVSYALNDVTDALGEEYQWLTVTGGWHPDSFWIPDIRLGYSANQTGTEVSIYNLGLTLLDYVDLDLSMSSDEVTIDGETLPRGARASLGFQFAF